MHERPKNVGCRTLRATANEENTGFREDCWRGGAGAGSKIRPSASRTLLAFSGPPPLFLRSPFKPDSGHNAEVDRGGVAKWGAWVVAAGAHFFSEKVPKTGFHIRLRLRDWGDPGSL